ncbi:MAG TPA: DNA-formamidopyrimidine glycosylase family protein [Chthoniobacterales bacterium]|jgi:formamidopyrimidine-DNA glycosylase|nr:DNA-formamidopyrimidine glycosylase family protein [Chthoniobacterales bacterium]
MPELAEVEFYRRQWDPGLRQKILRVQVHAAKRIFRGSNPRGLVRELTGQKLLRSSSWGKQMLFEFSGGNWLGIHLGMTGTLRVESRGVAPEKHDHLVLHQAKRALVLRDARLFGRVRFHRGKSSPEWWRTGAPDIGSESFDREFFDTFLKRHSRAPIKAVLLLQNGFAGIGNWMADEILWRAKVAPLIGAGELGPRHRQRVFEETRFVASESLRLIAPEFGDAPPDWLIHQKWKQKGVCPRHQTPLRKAMIGGRTTAWCPRCQK